MYLAQTLVYEVLGRADADDGKSSHTPPPDSRMAEPGRCSSPTIAIAPKSHCSRALGVFNSAASRAVGMRTRFVPSVQPVPTLLSSTNRMCQHLAYLRHP